MDTKVLDKVVAMLIAEYTRIGDEVHFQTGEKYDNIAELIIEEIQQDLLPCVIAGVAKTLDL